MSGTIHDVLSYFREEAFHSRDLGDKFERLIASYLTHDPKYADLFGGNVWLWTEWPHHNKMPDTGIDLVAEETATGDVWAIQCKFWQPDSYVPKADIDSFLATSSKHPFKKRLIVSTTDKWTSNAEDNLRGNARTSGEQRRMERGNVFGEGTRTPVAITLLVKKSGKKAGCALYYHDIGDYLTREEKLASVTKFASTKSIPWEQIMPNKNHDWINQRDEKFGTFMPVGLKEEKGSQDVEAPFVMYSAGVKTNRDPWAYNFSKTKLAQNMARMVEHFNEQVAGFKKASSKGIKVKDFIDTDPKKIGWSGSTKCRRCGSASRARKWTRRSSSTTATSR